MTEAPSLEDQPTQDHYRALLAEHGWPPIKGGSPELDEESGEGGSVTETPEESDQSGGEDSLPEFDYSEIPDDLRETVEKRVKGFQAKFTQAQQGLAETRREAETNAQILEALRSGNPDVARAILNQFGYDANAVLGMYGYQTDDGEEEFTDPDEQLRQEVQELRQERETEKQTREREAQESAVTDYISEGIESLEQREQRQFDKEEHQAIDALSRQFPKEVGGRLIPDYEGAYDLLHGIVKAGHKRRLSGPEGAPRRPGGGSAGSRTVDLSKESPEEFTERVASAVDQARASAQ